MSLQANINQLLGMTGRLSQVSQRFPKVKNGGNNDMKRVANQKLINKENFNKLKSELQSKALTPHQQKVFNTYIDRIGGTYGTDK